jgi:hypothetical protein
MVEMERLDLVPQPVLVVMGPTLVEVLEVHLLIREQTMETTEILLAVVVAEAALAATMAHKQAAQVQMDGLQSLIRVLI